MASKPLLLARILAAFFFLEYARQAFAKLLWIASECIAFACAALVSVCATFH